MTSNLGAQHLIDSKKLDLTKQSVDRVSTSQHKVGAKLSECHHILCLLLLQWIKYGISVNAGPLRSICITIIKSVVLEN